LAVKIFLGVLGGSMIKRLTGGSIPFDESRDSHVHGGFGLGAGVITPGSDSEG
jgi:hypothetical protein